MTLALFAQGMLFFIIVLGAVALIRRLNDRRLHRAPLPSQLGRRRGWIVPLAASASLFPPVMIVLLGHETEDFEFTWYDIEPLLSTGFATLFLGTALACAWTALRWDRPHGRRRCPRCWYDMRGIPALTCPECGFHAARESQLQRTRRSRRLAMLALLSLVVSYVALKAPFVRTTGWGGAIPMTPLILGLRFAPYNAVVGSESRAWALSSRFRYDLWPWQDWLLNKHADYLFTNSSNIELVRRLNRFISDERYLSEAATVALVEAIANSKDEHANDVPNLGIYVSAKSSLTPETQATIAAAIRRGLASEWPRRARDIVVFAPFAPNHAAELASIIAARIERQEQEFVTLGTFALGQLADKNDQAWELYRARIDAPESEIRRYRIRLLSLIKSRREIVLPIAEAALDDPDDEVVYAATRAVAHLSHDVVRDHRELLVRVANRRSPRISSDILFTLCARGCDHPDVLALASNLLKLDDKDHLQMTLWAIARLADRAKPLRADLEAFAKRPVAAQLEGDLADTMAALERAYEEEEVESPSDGR